jgi:hypothetical protein
VVDSDLIKLVKSLKSGVVVLNCRLFEEKEDEAADKSESKHYKHIVSLI